MAEITLFSTFELISNGLKAISNLSNSLEVKAKVSELYEAIIAGQNRALESSLREQRLVDEVGNLKEQLRKVETWETEKKRYELSHLPGGHFTFALKKQSTGDEPFHQLCSTCFNNGKKSILHVVHLQGAGTSYRCLEEQAHCFTERR
ncbi:MAG TPA: hypothetical protein VGM16_09145 [Gammaproteobacteria bacterium]|jgi:hypothetical protein